MWALILWYYLITYSCFRSRFSFCLDSPASLALALIHHHNPHQDDLLELKLVTLKGEEDAEVPLGEAPGPRWEEGYGPLGSFAS